MIGLKVSARLALAIMSVTAGAAAHAAIVITEVDPFGNSASYGGSTGGDWFELTNTGTSAVSIAGYTMTDNHAASNTATPYAVGATISIGNLSGSRATFGPAVLTLAGGATSLAAGQSAVFIESSSNASGSSTLIGKFESAWFGANVPANFLVGTYNDGGGSGTLYGLGTDSDMVNIFNGSTSGAALMASVAFGADTGTPVATFDNALGLNDVTLTQKSVAGVNGAFLSANGAEIGSPGAVPLPPALILFSSGFAALAAVAGFGRRRGAVLARG
jgi:hypothetical protein